MILLLYAFTAATGRRRTLFVLLAASFHLTAIPFYGIYLLRRQGKRGIAVLVVLILLVRTLFPALVGMADAVPDVVKGKLIYYLDNSDGYTASDIGSLKLIGLCALSVLSFLAQGFRLDRDTRAWNAIPWITAVVHVLLLPISLASLRITLAIHSVLTGVIAFRLFARDMRGFCMRS